MLPPETKNISDTAPFLRLVSASSKPSRWLHHHRQLRRRDRSSPPHLPLSVIYHEAMNHAPNLVPPTQTPPSAFNYCLHNIDPHSFLFDDRYLPRHSSDEGNPTVNSPPSSFANCSHPPLLLDTLSLSCSLSFG
ncbi:hypothetical protein L2E82_18255 [Cichorium intybus]|uniref:Uncharacterized protein n=1 Tax=Cichorium intybus TaxID=13427 RepID=A0ACB9F8Y9_CICIN|nr:hypothetical protein L2E82_18255 [Cichorium intybus]